MNPKCEYSLFRERYGLKQAGKSRSPIIIVWPNSQEEEKKKSCENCQWLNQVAYTVWGERSSWNMSRAAVTHTNNGGDIAEAPAALRYMNSVTPALFQWLQTHRHYCHFLSRPVWLLRLRPCRWSWYNCCSHFRSVISTKTRIVIESGMFTQWSAPSGGATN